ncbi:MAG: amidase [Gammaproteobacteria bacterium]|nr:amidase [Gammaproteobacteria bacterium]MDH3467072.1 amidase [Gammaproteobacteria bacterium]
MTEILYDSINATAKALRNGSVSARELADEAIRRHASISVDLNPYKTWCADLARRSAATADAAFASGTDLGVLQGIPVSIKDLYGVRGADVYAGTPTALPSKWQYEGPVVGALRRQLAVIMGKTHTVELAFGGLGVNPHWGTPRNPWDAARHRVPGGSSSGAGVSLCEGSAFLALGTDTAGSVRIPASVTGNVGMKTSYGRWSLQGIVPLSPTLDTAGVLTRSVDDLAHVFPCIDDPHRDNESPIAVAPLAGLRIGVPRATMWNDCEDGIDDVCDNLLTDLTRAGAILVDIELPEASEAVALLHKGNVVSAECDEFLSAELPAWRETLDPLVASRIKDGGAIEAREYLARRRLLRELAAAAAARFDDCDVIAAPTVPISPPILQDVLSVDGYRPRNLASLRNTCVGNSLSLCALTVPAGIDRNSLPVGIQLMAAHGRDRELIATGLGIERHTGTPLERLGRAPLCK